MSESRAHNKIHNLRLESDIGITMRDGVRLSARICRPDGEGRFPVLLAVSPYQHRTDGIPHSTLFLSTLR